MNSFGLNPRCSDGDNLDYDGSENELDNDYAASRDVPSDEDQQSYGESEGGDANANDVSVNDTESNSGDNIASENSSSSSSDEEEEEIEMVSIGNDVDEAAEDDDVIDGGSDDSGSDGGEERVHTGSDDGSLDEEAEAEDNEDDVSGESNGEDPASEDDEDSSSSSDDGAEGQQDNEATTDRITADGHAHPHEEQNLETVHDHVTYQAYRPTNNYQSTTTYQSYNNYQKPGNHATDNTRDRVPRCLPEAPALLETPTPNYSHASAGAKNIAHASKSSSKTRASTTSGSNETTRAIRNKSKGKCAARSADAKPKPPRKPKQASEHEAGSQGGAFHKLHAPGVLTALSKAVHMPVVTKHSSLIHGMKDAPVLGANHMPNNMKQQFAIHGLEQKANTSTHFNHAHVSENKTDNLTSATISPHHEPRYSRTRSYSVSSSVSGKTTPWVRTTFDNPNTILLDAILSAVTMPSGALLKDICKHSLRATIGISISVEGDSGLQQDGLRKYKTTEDGVTLWWKPYKATPS